MTQVIFRDIETVMTVLQSKDRLDLGNRIAAARVRKRLNQSELARRLGIKAGLLGEIERGLAPCGLGRLVRIAEALDVPLSELRDGPPPG